MSYTSRAGRLASAGANVLADRIRHDVVPGSLRSDEGCNLVKERNRSEIRGAQRKMAEVEGS